MAGAPWSTMSTSLYALARERLPAVYRTRRDEGLYIQVGVWCVDDGSAYHFSQPPKEADRLPRPPKSGCDGSALTCTCAPTHRARAQDASVLMERIRSLRPSYPGLAAGAVIKDEARCVTSSGSGCLVPTQGCLVLRMLQGLSSWAVARNG